MNKKELIEKAAQQAGLSQKDTAAALNAILATITESLVNKEKVALIGFGTFETKDRAARTGKNPRTGEAVQIEAAAVPAFKAGAALKNAVNVK
ncbi:MAG: HU family DNA-binding protein [Clostridia bacterium]|nr:HU family DNA-binding protein [Clostridia bacterium]